jgi:hypothetical protein
MVFPAPALPMHPAAIGGAPAPVRPWKPDRLTRSAAHVVIFGLRTKVFVLTVLTLVCPRCGNRAAHPLHRSVTKFTLFFIPLFPVRTRYTTQCTFCGLTNRLSKDQANGMLQQAGGHAPGHGAPEPYRYPPRG